MRKRILLIEDDPGTSRIISYALDQAGFEVVTAKDGIEGLSDVKNKAFDLLILDVMLPGLDGFQVCRELRTVHKNSSLPVLMLSAKTQEADRKMGIKVGANDYLTKPIRPAEVVNRVEALLTAKTQ